jgi:hypothetical protein
MKTREQKRLLLEGMTELLELPDSAYEKATERYESLGEWLGRDESLCKENDPHIFPQGSFRLGTAIRPLEEDETYDLDLACKLRAGIDKSTHTQEMLKKLVGHEIETFRKAKGITAPKEEKHRCWRLEYQDDLSFHMDVVPCISADEIKVERIAASMKKLGESEFVAGEASHLTVSVTDNRHPSYIQICDDWNISNPEGYAKWFETRMISESRMILKCAKVDDMPSFERKTPLQRSIQLLKRHRDLMFKDDNEVKPISIIITTLAARAYQGETDVESALIGILANMGEHVNPSNPKVPNPVDPEEDFADKWSMPEYRHLKLEQNFKNWLMQAQADFALLFDSDDVDFLVEQTQHKFSVSINRSDMVKRLGLASTAAIIIPKTHVITDPVRPWGYSIYEV